MKEIPLNHPIEKGWKLVIPEDYQKIPLPYFKEWTSTLESGEYKQTKNRLCLIEGDDCSYCCLGILSKIQGRLTADGGDGDFRHWTYLSDSNPLLPFFGSIGYLPKGIRVYSDDDYLVSLSVLNDEGLPFSEIAKVIKEIWCEEEKTVDKEE